MKQTRRLVTQLRRFSIARQGAMAEQEKVDHLERDHLRTLEQRYAAAERRHSQLQRKKLDTGAATNGKRQESALTAKAA